MTETARIPVPPGPGRDWVRLGRSHPAWMEAVEAYNVAVVRAPLLDPITLEALRVRVAITHNCER